MTFILRETRTTVREWACCISWREQVNFQWDYDEVRFVLDQHAELDFYSANSLRQQSVDRHVAPLGHIILILSQPEQGSPHLQNTGRLNFPLREHEGEVKAWQRDFQQLHRDMFPQICCFFASFKKKLHLKCTFADILLISFIFNFKFMFCTCIVLLLLILYLLKPNWWCNG
jgi:hypothetical protein